MADEPPDLAPLRASNLHESEDRVVRRVMAQIRARGMAPITARARHATIDEALGLIARLALPIAAAIVFASFLSAALLARRPAERASPSEMAPTAAAALGVDPRFARWASRPTELPSAAEVMMVFSRPAR